MIPVARVVEGRKPGQLALVIQNDPTELKGEFRALVLPLGDTRYECRHGTGTAAGFYPCAPDKSCAVGLKPGMLVQITSIAGHYDVPNSPPWVRKIYFLRVRPDEKAMAEESARKARYAAIEDARAAFIAAAENVSRPARQDKIQAVLTALRAWRAVEPNALRYAGRAALNPDKIEADLAAFVAGDDTLRWRVGYVSAIATILTSSTKPTLAYRSLPDEWRRRKNLDWD